MAPENVFRASSEVSGCKVQDQAMTQILLWSIRGCRLGGQLVPLRKVGLEPFYRMPTLGRGWLTDRVLITE